jgi:hypothetical protein
MVYMARQMNLNVTPAFEKDLAAFMRRRKITVKSDAVRVAVHEAVARMNRGKKRDFRPWLGAALRFPPNLRPRFQDEDQLW